MSVVLWRITQTMQGVKYAAPGTISGTNYYFSIFLSAAFVGAVHCSPLELLTIHVNFSLIAYVALEGGVFSLISGYLFWKYGLECAITASLIFQTLIILVSKLT